MKNVDSTDSMYEVPVPDDVNQYKILIIEEDQVFSRDVASILRQASYQVTEIENPEVGIWKIEEEPNSVDVVLVGTPLKAMDCIDVLEDILAIHEDMPVIFMLPKADRKFAVTALCMGATQVLDSPIKKYDLLSLWQYVEYSRSVAERRNQSTRNRDEEVAIDEPATSSNNSFVG